MAVNVTKQFLSPKLVRAGKLWLNWQSVASDSLTYGARFNAFYIEAR